MGMNFSVALYSLKIPCSYIDPLQQEKYPYVYHKFVDN